MSQTLNALGGSTALTGQAYLKVDFEPKNQIQHGETKYTFAVRFTPVGLAAGAASDGSIKMICVDLSDSMNEEEKLTMVKAAVKEAIRTSVAPDDWFVIL